MGGFDFWQVAVPIILVTEFIGQDGCNFYFLCSSEYLFFQVLNLPEATSWKNEIILYHLVVLCPKLLVEF